MTWLLWGIAEKPKPVQQPPPRLPSPKETNGLGSAIRSPLKDRLSDHWQRLSPEIQIASTAIATAVGIAVYHRYFRRIRNAGYVTPDILENKRIIKGVVTSVGDGDNFHLCHTPGFGWRWPFKFRDIPATTKGETIHIRLAGIDAPEAGHFGNEAEPYADEALEWLRKNLEGKTVHCQVLGKDRFFRIIATAQVDTFDPLFISVRGDVSLAMLNVGLAEVYDKEGAQYGAWGKEIFIQIEAEAKAARRGIWATYQDCAPKPEDRLSDATPRPQRRKRSQRKAPE